MSPRRAVRSLAVALVLALATLPAAPPAAAAGQQWRLVAEDGFSGALAPHWSAYQGTPACCRQTDWARSQAVERDGRLVLTAQRQPDGNWLAGGVSAAGWPAAVRTYGKYVARVRVDRGAGISAVALLWPRSNGWPPELDYYELSGQDPDRTGEQATAHRAGDNAQLHSAFQGDLTQWHVVSMEWLPGSISYFVDNRLIGRVTDPSYIPHQPMWPGFQLQVGSTGQYDGGSVGAGETGPVTMDVDWFAVYAPAAPSSATPTPPTSTAPTSSSAAPPPSSAPVPPTGSAPPVAAPPGPARPGWPVWPVAGAGGLLLLALVWWLLRRRLR